MSKVRQPGALAVDETTDGAVEEGIVVVAGARRFGERFLDHHDHALFLRIGIQGTHGVGAFAALFIGAQRAGVEACRQVEAELAAEHRDLYFRCRLGARFAGGMQIRQTQQADDGQGQRQGSFVENRHTASHGARGMAG
ncbi:hypothetical protein D9M71_723880 [compost metagenome]